MNSLYKIISRSVLMTSLVAFLLLFFNVFFALYWLNEHPQYYPTHYRTISNNLYLEGQQYVLTPDGMTYLEEQFSWAMLLDDSGEIIWSWQPVSYTHLDVYKRQAQARQCQHSSG